MLARRRCGTATARLTPAAALILAPLLCGCSHSESHAATTVSHDTRTELRREQDCADPKWKAANLGLWYNVCHTSPF
jgi:hypothetical protein